MLATGPETPGIKSDQMDELPQIARRPERKNEKMKKIAHRVSCGCFRTRCSVLACSGWLLLSVLSSTTENTGYMCAACMHVSDGAENIRD